jgi:hypothetical protein
MIRRIRHWLRMPLFTKRELRNLNGFWFAAVTHDFVRVFTGDQESLKLSLEVSDALDEFLAAIEWIEGMQA